MFLSNLIWGVILETIILIAMFVVCFKLLLEKRKQKLKIENLNLYNQTLTNMYDGIRSLKHDYVNFIQCLKGYTLCNDMTGVKEMVDSVYEESRDICNMEFLSPEIINNPAIYHLLLNKYQEACHKNISMTVEVNYDLQQINIDTYTLCRILGILVDNAIESAQNSKRKLLYVRFVQENHHKSVFVENSYDDSKVIDLEKIFEKGYSTKEDGKDHGLGLWKVKQIVENSRNLELRTNRSYLFSQELVVKETMTSLLLSEKGENILFQ